METTIKSSEAIFYVLAWTVAALAGISRQLSLVDTVTCRNIVSVGCNSGFLGFAVVALYVRNSSGFVGSEFYYLGFAAVIGLAGKEQEKILSLVWRKIMGDPSSGNKE